MASNNLEQDSHTTSDHPGPDVISPSLLTLPDAALTKISQHSKYCEDWEDGHPLLPVSRACRDIVLSSIHSIFLNRKRIGWYSKRSKPTLDSAPRARLLNRACCQAPPSLVVQLCLPDAPDSLPELLQPGIDCGGWSKVRALQVTDASCGTHLIPDAFPALLSLSLRWTQLGDGSLFSQLAAQPNPSLIFLELVECHIDSEAVQRAAVALAQLPDLQILHLEGPDPLPPIAEHLTGLTSLDIITEGTALDEQQVTVAAQNQGLRSLTLGSDGKPEQVLQPDLLQRVLTSCTGLTQLTLTLGVDDQGLGVLLTHGTSITDLMLGNTSLTTSKADWACSWRKLTLCDGVLKEFAYLPLRTVQELQVRPLRLWAHETLEPLVGLSLPKGIPTAQLPDLLHQATTNLASCPAWAEALPSELRLSGAAEYLDSAQGLQLLQALAPVAGRHVSKLFLDLKMDLGQAEVEALADALAGSLTHLHLNSATLHATFWRSLAQHFPNLQELYLDSNLRAAAMDLAVYLAMLSSKGQPTPDIKVEVFMFREKDERHLKACVAAWGLQDINMDCRGAFKKHLWALPCP